MILACKIITRSNYKRSGIWVTPPPFVKMFRFFLAAPLNRFHCCDLVVLVIIVVFFISIMMIQTTLCPPPCPAILPSSFYCCSSPPRSSSRRRPPPRSTGCYWHTPGGDGEGRYKCRQSINSQSIYWLSKYRKMQQLLTVWLSTYRMTAPPFSHRQICPPEKLVFPDIILAGMQGDWRMAREQLIN